MLEQMGGAASEKVKGTTQKAVEGVKSTTDRALHWPSVKVSLYDLP